MKETWGQWIRSDKLLLTILFGFMVWVVMHMSHDQMDKEQISWAREAAGTILGGLLGLITGVRIGQAMAMIPTSPPPPAVDPNCEKDKDKGEHNV